MVGFAAGFGSVHWIQSGLHGVHVALDATCHTCQRSSGTCQEPMLSLSMVLECFHGCCLLRVHPWITRSHSWITRSHVNDSPALQLVLGDARVEAHHVCPPLQSMMRELYPIYVMSWLDHLCVVLEKAAAACAHVCTYM
jgi:hypothetical protein